MGYDDPTKDLRKAVKAKEKAAKKARKAKKKKTGKKEDLFDPENLAKFKAELEERKRREEEFAKEKVDQSEDSEHSQKSPEAEAGQVEATDTEIKFTLDLENDPTDLIKNTNSVSATPNLKSPLTPVRNTDTDDWKLFQSLTSGVDAVIKQKKEELQEIKVDSYFQHKPQAVDPEEDHLDSDADQDKAQCKIFSQFYFRTIVSLEELILNFAHFLNGLRAETNIVNKFKTGREIQTKISAPKLRLLSNEVNHS